MAAGAPLFDDGKDADAMRTIGEVAAALNIRQHVLRYWEEQFPMLKPLTRGGGRRYYRPEDVRLVQTIDRLVHQQGFTLRGARLALEGKGAELPAAGSAATVVRRPHDSGDHLARLAALRDKLARALAQA
jgi:DNA-binding transcriptional MerR regulator